MCSLLVVSFIPFPSEMLFLSDFTSESLSFYQILPQNILFLLSVNFYLRTSFFLYDFTSEPPFFCQILTQNYLPSLRFYLRTPIFIFSNVIVRPNFLNYSLPCCCSVTQSCMTFCDSMDYSTPGFPILHYFLELAQTHVH